MDRNIMRLHCVLIVSWFCVFDHIVAWGANRVKLRDVEVLTLKHGHYTTGRRLKPVPQVRCLEGQAGCIENRLDVIQCRNRGYDGRNINWECEADMDKAYRFGEIVVSCEGYDDSHDPYILQGSCGITYRLEYTERPGFGRENCPRAHPECTRGHGKRIGNGSSHSVWEKFSIGLIISVLLFLMLQACNKKRNATSTNDASDDDIPPRMSSHNYFITPTAPPLVGICTGCSEKLYSCACSCPPTYDEAVPSSNRRATSYCETNIL